jgi:hypothetical protein
MISLKLVLLLVSLSSNPLNPGGVAQPRAAAFSLPDCHAEPPDESISLGEVARCYRAWKERHGEPRLLFSMRGIKPRESSEPPEQAALPTEVAVPEFEDHPWSPWVPASIEYHGANGCYPSPVLSGASEPFATSPVTVAPDYEVHYWYLWHPQVDENCSPTGYTRDVSEVYYRWRMGRPCPNDMCLPEVQVRNMTGFAQYLDLVLLIGTAGGESTLIPEHRNLAPFETQKVAVAQMGSQVINVIVK